MTIDIKDHELKAMRQLVMHTRAIAGSILKDDADYSQKLINWAQMVEDFTARVDQSRKS